MRSGVVGGQLDGPVVVVDRGGQIVHSGAHSSAHKIGVGVVRLKRHSLAAILDRGLVLRCALIERAAAEVDVGVIRRKLDRAAKVVERGLFVSQRGI